MITLCELGAIRHAHHCAVRRTALVLEVVLTQQIGGFDLLRVAWKDNADWFMFAPSMQRPNAKVINNAMIEPGPLHAGHTGESVLVLSSGV